MKTRLRKVLLFWSVLCVLVGCLFLPENAFAGVSKTAKPGSVKLVSATSPDYNRVTVSWKAAKNATNYVVYYKKSSSKKWIKLKTVSSKSTSYTHKSSSKYPIVVGQKYNYTVRAYNKYSKKYGGYSTKGLSVRTYPLAVSLKSVKLSSDKKSVTVSWGRSYGNNYYYVYRKTGSSGSWTRIAKVKASTKRTQSYVDKNPVKGTVNLYTVRGYNSKYKLYGGYNKTGISVDLSVSGTDSVVPTPTPVEPSKPVVSPSPTPAPVKPSNPVATPTPTPYPGVKVDKVTYNGSLKYNYMVGDTFDLNKVVEVLPSNATDKTIIYESTNDSVATVKDGVIEAKSEGRCAIRVYSNCNGKWQGLGGVWLTDGFTVSVTVVNPYTDIASITFDDSSVVSPIVTKNIPIGTTRQVISYRVDCPGNGGNTEYVFSSSDPSILTVDQSGNITGVSTGFASVIVTSKYPNRGGNYISGSTTYHVGDYDTATIMKYIRRDKVAEEVFIEEINTERVKNGLPAFKYSKYSEECSLVRALYNIFTNIQEPTTCKHVAGHGGSQNGAGGLGGGAETIGVDRGKGLANAILSSPGHYSNNMTTKDDYAWCTVLNYCDPAGVGFSLMIETFGGPSSDEEWEKKGADYTLKIKCLDTSLSKEVYLKYKDISELYPISEY